MKSTRRKFLKMAGVAALGLGIEAASRSQAHALPEDTQFSKPAQALVGKRWGMVVDTTKFNTPEDFLRCIEACHDYHNVPAIPNKKEIKWIWADNFHRSFPNMGSDYMKPELEHKNFLLLCNHCENPPCVRVCPTKATFRREDGIVEMDMHRCIGCRFCMAACPYGARSFNFYNPRNYLGETNQEFPTRKHGVVEKCTFCSSRLDHGQMPRCVEVSEGGLLFGDLADPASEVRQALEENFTIRRKPDLGTEPSVFYII